MKQTSRRLTSLLLAVALLLSFAVPGFAADEWWREYFVTPMEDWSITDDGVVETQGANLLLTSDVHQYPYLAEDLIAAANANVTEGEVGLVSFGGDFANDYVLYEDYMSILKVAIGDTPATYTKGNHEGSTSDEEFIQLTGMSRIGETAVNEDGNYHFFNFGSPAKNQEFLEADIAQLEAYLGELEDDKPVFIVSHYPLHYYNDRRNSTNADKVVDLLNQYPQAIFFWGHNHTEQDPCYGTIRVPGDLIQTGVDASSSKEIKFTYVNLGALRDGVNSANGVLAEVNGNEVTFKYISLANAVTDDVWVDLRGGENAVREATAADVSSTTVVKTDAPQEVIKQATLLIDRPLVDKAPAAAADEYSDKFSASEITWTGALTADGNYDFSTQYTASVTLTAEEGYSFAADAAISVNKEFVGPMPGQKNNLAVVVVSEDGKTADVTYTFPATVNPAAQPYEAATELVEGQVYVVAAVDENLAVSYYYDITQHGEESRPDYTVAAADVVVRDGKLVSEVTVDTTYTAQKDASGYLLWSDESMKAFGSNPAATDANNLNILTMSTRGGDLGLEAAITSGMEIYTNWSLDASGAPYLNLDGTNKYLKCSGGKFAYVDDPAESNVRLFPVGTADGTVNNVSVAVTAPAPGAAAVNEAVATGGTVESVTWSAESFDYATEYTVTATVAPTGALGSNVIARVNGNPATAEVAEGKVVVTYTFDATSGAPGAVVEADTSKVDAIESGSRYVVVAEGYALTYNYVDGVYMKATPVTVEDGKITSEITEDMIFTLETGSDGGYTFFNGGRYLDAASLDGTPDNWGFMDATAAADAISFAYADGLLTVASTGAAAAGPGAPPPPPPGGAASALYLGNGHFHYATFASSPVELYLVAEEEPIFSDVEMDAYYYDSILWAVENGITEGIGGGKFGPGNELTRAEIVTLIWRAEGEQEPAEAENPFSDVAEDAWYAKAVLWAVENGITEGVGGGKFNPGKTCTRAEIVTMLHRAAGEPDATGENTFSDVAEDAWYLNAVLWAVENGITEGIGGGKFGPVKVCDRAQAVTFIHRAYQE